MSRRYDYFGNKPRQEFFEINRRYDSAVKAVKMLKLDCRGVDKSREITPSYCGVIKKCQPVAFSRPLAPDQEFDLAPASLYVVVEILTA